MGDNSMPNPIQQGNLDGLCGLYSTINAIDCLLDLDYDDLIILFEIGIDYLDRRTNLKNTILNGMTIHMVQGIFNKYKDTLSDWGWNISVQKFEAGNIRGLIGQMQKWLNEENQCLVVGIHGRFNHWTCIPRSFKKNVKFYDSDGLKQLHISRLTTGMANGSRDCIIDPGEVLGIRLERNTD